MAIDLDFDQTALVSFLTQDGQNSSPTHAEPLEGGKTLHLSGNSWKGVQVNYPVTPETVLRFDFSSDVEGELHNVELAGDLNYNNNVSFQLYGTQTWGIQNFRDYTPSGDSGGGYPAKAHYEIPIGQFFSGPLTYLGFVNDDDIAAQGHSYFSNVWLFDAQQPLSSLSLTGDFDGDTIQETITWNDGAQYWEFDSLPGDTPEVFGIGSPPIDWTDAIVGDWNGDGRDDLAGRDRLSGAWEVGISTGFDFHRSDWGAIDHHTQWETIYAADFSGDGREDLLGWNSAEATWQLLPYLESGVDKIVPWGTASAAIDARNDLKIGDANQDGRADLIRDDGANWQVALSLENSLGAAQNWGDWFDEWVNPDGSIDVNGPSRTTLEIFQDITNTVELQLYPGLMKGPQATKQTLAGGVWDQAALFVQELETAGIEADLAFGRVQAPASQVADWVGAKSAVAARDILRIGVDSTATLLQSTTLGEVIEFDHAWARVLLPNSLGLPSSAQFDQWTNFDPSWKFRDFQTGLDSITIAVPFDQADYLSEVRDELPVEFYEDMITDYLVTNHPGASIAEVPYDGPILTRSFTHLSDAFRVTPLSEPTRYDNLLAAPAAEKHRVRISVKRLSDGFTMISPYEISVPEQSLERFTLSSSNPGIGRVVLRVDGEAEQYSPLFLSAGTDLELKLEHLDPGDDVVDNTQVYTFEYGEYVAIGLDARQYSHENLADAQSELNLATLNALDSTPSDPGEAVVGGVLSLAVAKYWHNYAEQSDRVTKLMNAVPAHPRVGSGIATSSPQVSYYSDLQYPAVPQDFGIDLQNGVYAGVDNTSGTLQVDAARLATLNASALEHATVQEFTNATSVSTVKGLQLAAEAGDPVYVFKNIPGQGVLATTLTGSTIFSGGTTADIRNAISLPTSVEDAIVTAVNSSETVTAPKFETSLPQWNGSVYITEKVSSSLLEFAYIIDGGFGPMYGGFQADLPAPAPVVPIAQSNPHQTFAGDPVNVANGNVFRDEVDVVLPNIGFPLHFSRHYDSQNEDNMANLGVGWTHSYADSLVYVDSDNDSLTDIVWNTSTGARHTFLNNGSGYDVPGTYQGTLYDGIGYYEFRDKNGTTRRFDDSGKYLSITDRNANALLLEYHGNGTLEEVRDLHDNSRKFTFGYSGQKMTSVSDFTGRTWSFGYQTIDSEHYLTSATPPTDSLTISAPTLYEYYDTNSGDYEQLEGLLKSIVEPGGGWHSYEYYPNRRAFRVTEGVEGAIGAPNGVTSSHHFRFDLSRNITTFVDERGIATTYRHDEEGLLLRQTHADRTHDDYLWQDMQMVSHTNAAGYEETFDYSTDGLANLEETVSFDGVLTRFEYEPSYSQVTKVTVNPGPEQQVDEFFYDSSGNLLRARDALNQDIRYQVDERGQVISRTDANGSLLADHLLAHWAFNGDGDDLSVIDAKQLAESPGASFVIGQDGYGEALQLDASSARVDLASPIDLGGASDPDGWTVSAWFQAPLPDHQGSPHSLILGSAGDRQIMLDSSMNLGTKVSGSFYSSGFNPSALLTSGWHHLIAVGTTDDKTEFYLDGIYRGTANAKAETHVVGIGANEFGDERFANVIDEVRIYDVQLTADQVKELAGLQGDFTTFFEHNAAGQVVSTRASAVHDGAIAETTTQFDTRGYALATTDSTGITTEFEYDLLGRQLASRVVYQNALHADDFNRANSTDLGAGWSELIGNWQIDSNRVGLSDNPTGTANLLWSESPSSTNYTVEAVVQSTDYLLAKPGLWASYQGPGNYHIVELRDNGATQIVNLSTWKNGALQKQESESVFAPSGVDHLLSLTLNGSRLSVRLNGEEVISSLHPTFDSPGQVGLSINGSTKTAVTFNNFTLSSSPTIRRTYNELGDLLSTTNPRGDQTTNVYDLKRRLIEVHQPNGTEIAFQFDAAGNQVAAIDELGQRTDIVFNTRNRPIQTRYADGATTRARFDSVGNLTRATDTNGISTDFVYDSSGRTLKVTDPLGHGTTNRYDASGNLLSTEDRRGFVTLFEYDDLNRLIESRSPIDGEFDSNGDLDNVSAYYAISTLDYDANGNAIAQTNYDLTGLTISQIPDDPRTLSASRKRTVSTRYDVLDRAVETTDEAGNTSLVSYDLAGRILSRTDRMGSVTDYVYDSLGREILALGPWVELPVEVFSPWNNLTDSLDVDGNGFFTLDDVQAVEAELADREFSDPISQRLDAPGQTPAPFYFDVSGDGFLDGYDLTILLDNYYGPAPPPSPPQARPRIQTDYDIAGNVVAAWDAEGYRSVFEYDPQGRLTTSVDPVGGVSKSVYSLAGQRIGSQDALGNANRLLYDTRGRLQTEILPDPDDAGPLSPPTTDLEYDASGYLIRQTDPLGHATQYEYDELGRQTTLVQRAQNVIFADFSKASVDPYDANQDNQDDLGSTWEVLEGGSTLRLEGNAWKKIDLPSNFVVTANTILEFEFKSATEGEVHAIGFDSDTTTEEESLFKLWGNQAWGLESSSETQIKRYDGENGWKHYRLRVGDFSEFNTGPAQYLTFVADDDVNGAAESQFRHVKVYDENEAAIIRQSYDAEGNLIGRVDALGRKTQWTYDGLGRVTTETLPDPDGAAIVPFDQGDTSLLTPEWSELVGDWEITGGQLELADNPSGTAKLLKSQPVESSTYTVDAILRSADYDLAKPGLWAGYQGSGNFHIVELRNNGASQYVNLSTWKSGIAPVQSSSALVSAPEGEGHRLALSVEGTTLSVTLNGEEIIRAEHPTLDTVGQVGFSVNGPSKHLASFDDFHLTQQPTTRSYYNTLGKLDRVEDHQGRATDYLFDTVGRTSAQLAPDPDGPDTDQFERTDSTTLGAEWDEAIGDWEIDNNQLRLVTHSASTSAALWNDEPKSMTYTVEASVRSDDYALAKPGLWSGFQGAGNYHIVELREFEGEQSVHLATWRSGETPVQSSASVNAPAGQDHLLELTRIGSTIIVRLNGQEALRVEHPTFDSPGKAGLSINGSDKTAASFDNFQITEFQTTFFDYDANGNLITVQNASDPRGVVTAYFYDALGRQTEEVLDFGGPDPITANTTTTTGYDRNSNLIRLVDASSQETIWEYDPLGRQTRQLTTDPDGPGGTGGPGGTDLAAPITEWTYDSIGNVLTQSVLDVDAVFGQDLTTRFTYDALSRRTSVEEPNGDTTHHTYDANSNLSTQTDGAGNRIEFDYDELDRQIRTRIDGVNGKDDFDQSVPDSHWIPSVGDWETNGGVYQLADNPTSTALALWSDAPLPAEDSSLSPFTVEADVYSTSYGLARPGLWVEFQGQGYFHIVELRDNGANQIVHLSTWIHGAVQEVSSTTVPAPAGEEHHLSLTVSGAMLIVELNGQVVLSVDDHPVLGIAEHAGLTVNGATKTAASFDNFRLTNPLEDNATFDAVGNLIASTDRNGRTREFSYDQFDRLVEERWLDPEDNSTVIHTLDWSYDALGRLEEYGDSSLHYTNQYDTLDRLTEFRRDDLPNSASRYTYSYDISGNIEQIESNFAGSATRTMSVDRLDRLTRLEQEFVSLGADKRVDFTYHANGAFESITRFADLAATQKVVTTAFTYDQAQRLVGLSHSDAADATLADYAYTFDAADRIVEIEGLDQRFQYDAAGQLTTVTDNPVSGPTTDQETYSYDASGNRTSSNGASVNTSANNRLESDGESSFEYDLEGNLIRRTDLASSKFTEYQWDHRNRLTKVLKYDSPAPLNFSSYSLHPFDYQDGQHGYPTSAQVLGGGSTLRLSGNAWKAIQLSTPYQVTSETILEFDFASPTQGEIYGIGLDTDLDFDVTTTFARSFQLDGSDTALNQSFHNYTARPDTVHYSIPIGQFFTGAFTYLVFINDDDTPSPAAESYFSNVLLHEPGELALAKTIEYSYDILDQLLTKSTDLGANGQTDWAERYIYEGGQLQTVYDDLILDSLPFGLTDDSAVKNHYLQGPAVDQVLADEQFYPTPVGPAPLPDLYWPLADHLATVRRLAEYDDVSNNTAIVNTIDYDSFGNITNQTNPSTGHRFGYTGRDWDPDAELNYYRARWYDPSTGRFLNQDPIDADANAYRYVGNSPTLFVDPTGLVQADPVDTVLSQLGSLSNQQLTSQLASIGVSNAALNDIRQQNTNVLNLSNQIRKTEKQIQSYQQDLESATGFWDSVTGRRSRLKNGIANAESQLRLDRTRRSLKTGQIAALIDASLLGGTYHETGILGKAEEVSYLNAIGSGLKTGGKSVVNAGASTIVSVGTLGTVEIDPLIAVNAQDLANGYETSNVIARGSFELLAGIGTGVVGATGKAGKAVFLFDTASNAVTVGQGATNIYNNGASFGNVTQVVAGSFGLKGNVASGGDLLADFASDATRIRIGIDTQGLGSQLNSGVPLNHVTVKLAPKKGGRLGNAATRQHVSQVAGELESRGFVITGGGGITGELYIPGPGGLRRGSAYPDITASKNGRTLHINTIDTLKDGVTASAREARNATKIRSLKPNEHLVLIPKPR